AGRRAHPTRGARAMSELTLLVLRIGFLILMWAFVFMIVYALRSDLFGTRPRKLPVQPAGDAFPASPAASPVASPAKADVEPVRAQPHASGSTPRRLVITSGPKSGMEIDLPSE